MKRLAIVMCAAVLGGMMCGCQTRITAEKHPETIGETNGVAVVLSGGWYVTARSPLWADEMLRGLDVGTGADGTVWLRMDDYHRNLSTNAVAMTRTIFDGSTNLVAAIGKAYAQIASAGSADAVSSVAQKAYSLFKSKGGDESKSQVICEDGQCTVTDGAVSICCDADGNCSDCSIQ